MIPINGEVRHDVGLLGSPCFEIPRKVSRDEAFNALSDEPQRAQVLAAKARHNALTMMVYLFVRYLLVAGLVIFAVVEVRHGKDHQSGDDQISQEDVEDHGHRVMSGLRRQGPDALRPIG